MTSADQKGTVKEAPERARVARIITAEQIVLDVGAEQGVTVGVRYKIVHTVDVPNPDEPGEQLASLEYVKAELEVTQVFEKVSIAKPPARTVPSMDFSLPYTVRSERPKLNIDESQVALGGDDLIIRVGDVATRVHHA